MAMTDKTKQSKIITLLEFACLGLAMFDEILDIKNVARNTATDYFNTAA